MVRIRKCSICAVASCPSPQNLKYHCFPRKPDIKRVWMRSCKRGKAIERLKSPRICDRHFREEDHTRDMEHELLGLPLRRILKPGSLPVLYMSAKDEDRPSAAAAAAGETAKEGEANPSDDGRRERAELKARKELVDELLRAHEESLPEDEAAQNVEGENEEEAAAPVARKERQLDLPGALAEVGRLRKLVAKRDEAIVKLKAENSQLKSMDHAQQLAAEVLRKRSFTKSQVMIMTTDKKPTTWPTEDILNGLMLRQMSEKAYEFIRRMGIFPLPSPPALNNWLRDYQITPCIPNDLKRRLIEGIGDGPRVNAVDFDSFLQPVADGDDGNT